MKSNHKWILGLAAGAGAAGLAYALWPKSKIPGGAIVSPFDKQKYMGVWHEIARMPNIIERNLRDVTEEYKLKSDGSIQVTTRAYHIAKNKPVAATGKMRVKGLNRVGKLQVTYVLPIFLNYNVLSIDDNYRYALVSGNSLDLLWILSRDTTIPDDIKTAFLQKAAALGFNISQLEWMS